MVFCSDLTVTGTGVELRAGLRVDPVETSDGVPVAVSYVANSGVGRALADVPERHLTAHESAGQTLSVSVIKVERDDWVR